MVTKLIVIGGPVILLGWAIYVTRELLGSRQWIIATGTVIESRVVSTPVARSMMLRHRARVVYRYQVNGLDFEGSRLALGPVLNNWRAYVAGIVRQYSIGTQVVVYHDPSDPHRACLRREGWGAVAIMVLVAFGILLITQIPAWAS